MGNYSKRSIFVERKNDLTYGENYYTLFRLITCNLDRRAEEAEESDDCGAPYV